MWTLIRSARNAYKMWTSLASDHREGLRSEAERVRVLAAELRSSAGIKVLDRRHADNWRALRPLRGAWGDRRTRPALLGLVQLRGKERGRARPPRDDLLPARERAADGGSCHGHAVESDPAGSWKTFAIAADTIHAPWHVLG